MKKINQLINSSSGFTLVELIMATALTTIVGIVLMTILIQNNGLFLNESTKINHGLSINAASSEINDTIRSAVAIVANCPPSTCTTAYSTDSSTLVLAIPALDASGNAISNLNDYVVITADPSNSKVLKKITFVNASSTRHATNKMLTNNLSLLKFYYLDQTNAIVTPTSATKINYVVNINELVGTQNQISSSSGQINLRNF